MKTRKILSLAAVLCIALCCFAACGGSENGGGNGGGNGGESAEILFEVSVQNPTVTQGESNAIIVTEQNLPADALISYEIKLEGGEWETLGSTTDRYFAHACDTLGEAEVRASTEVGENVYSAEALFTVVEFGGDTFGNSPDGDKASSGVDLYRDYGENAETEHKELDKISDEYAYFKGIKSDKFVATAYIDIIGNNSGDPNPKAGLFCKAGSEIWYFAFDVKPTFAGKEVVLVNNKSSWAWPGHVYIVQSLNFRKEGERVKNKMTLIRDGETFYMLINDVCLGSVKASGFTGASVVGTYTMAQHAVYSGYSCYTGGTQQFEEALADAIEQLS